MSLSKLRASLVDRDTDHTNRIQFTGLRRSIATSRVQMNKLQSVFTMPTRIVDSLQPERAQVAASAITVAVSVAVLLGWLVNSPLLMRIRADWPPVQPNTAAALLLVSVALLSARRGSARLARAFGLIAATVAALSMALDLWKIDLRVGDALIRTRTTAQMLHGAQMASHAEIGIVLLGIAASLTGAKLLAVVATLSVGAWALGAGALLGYATGFDAMYDWRVFAPMAPAAAASLLLLGSGLLWDRRAAATAHAWGAWQIPLVAGLGSITLTLLLFQASVVGRQDQVEATVAASVQRIRTEIRDAVQAQRDALAGLAREWDDTFFRRRSAWESDARIAFAKSQGMSTIAWYESSGERDWIYPPAVDAPRVTLPSQNATPESARTWMQPVKLADGTPGFALIAPLLHSGAVDGWLCGVYRSQEFFGALSSALVEGFSIRLESDREVIYDGASSEPVANRWLHHMPLERHSGITLTVHPTSDWLAQHRSLLPQVILVAGLVVSGLLVWALRSAQLSAARAVALEGEVKAHRSAEDEVRRLNLDLEGRVARRTEELQRTNEQLKGFASFLSHEIRQPVTAQALFAELLDLECGPSMDEQGREYIAQLRRSARRISDLIDAQLSLADISTSPLQVHCLNLDTIIEELTSDLKVAIDDANATIQADELLQVHGDARQIYQLFRNLIENSIKYRRPEVPIEVRITGNIDEAGVKIIYSDNGRGFDPADADRIFGAYERANESEAKGLGLGLAVCRRIMDRCGGRIAAQGWPGRGARFEIWFPADPQKAHSRRTS